jgi:hypothetical protein
MLHNIYRLLVAAVAVVAGSTLSPERRMMRKVSLSHQWRSIITSYDKARQMSVEAYGLWGVTPEIFAKYYAKMKSIDPHSRPLEAYYLIMEELTITHDLDPDIWS